MRSNYTATDEQKIDQIKQWLIDNNWSQPQLARLARMNANTFGVIISGQYTSPPQKQLDKIIVAIDLFAKTDKNMVPTVQTSVYKLVFHGCELAQRHRNFSIISTYVGLGKTLAARAFAQERENVAFIEALPTMTISSIANKLSSEFGRSGQTRTVNDRIEDLIDHLQGSQSLIVIDEAETLTPRVLELIRRIRDTANIGVVLLGTEKLMGIIRPHHGQFDQIRSRAGFFPQVIQRVNADDIAMVLDVAFADETLSAEFVSQIKSYAAGSMRTVAEGFVPAIKEHRKDQPLTPALVDAIAAQILTLSKS